MSNSLAAVSRLGYGLGGAWRHIEDALGEKLHEEVHEVSNGDHPHGFIALDDGNVAVAAHATDNSSR